MPNAVIVDSVRTVLSLSLLEELLITLVQII